MENIKYDQKHNSMTFTFNGSDGAVFFNTMGFICDGAFPQYGDLSSIPEGSEFHTFLKEKVLRTANLK